MLSKRFVVARRMHKAKTSNTYLLEDKAILMNTARSPDIHKNSLNCLDRVLGSENLRYRLKRIRTGDARLKAREEESQQAELKERLVG